MECLGKPVDTIVASLFPGLSNIFNRLYVVFGSILLIQLSLVWYE